MPALDPELLARLRDVPLKRQDGALLAANLRLHAAEHGWPVGQVDNAIVVASWAHAGAVRAVRGPHPVTSYIEHPLRVALRLCYWRVEKWSLVVAAILHDVVEDASPAIAAVALPDATAADIAALNEARARDIALTWIERQFDGEIARLVHAVSNPLPDGTARTAQQRRDDYAAHAIALLGDPDPALVKSSDLADNALSLHHQVGDEKMRRRVPGMARKYRPVLVEVIRRLGVGTYDRLLAPDMRQQILDQFRAGLNRVDQIIHDTEGLPQ